MMKCGTLYVEYEDEKTRMMNSVMYIVRWEYVLFAFPSSGRSTIEK